jgi:hypothetical protein
MQSMKSILKRLAPVLALICVCILLGKYFWGTPVHTSWQDTVDSFSGLVHTQGRVPEHLLQADAVKVGGEFDVSAYFSVLTHLSVEQGYTLDYVYYYGGLGGEPILYVRQMDQTPYAAYSEYIESFEATSRLGPWDVQSEYLDHVQVDGTPEGFFELIVLRTMGRQFYQYWHAGYNDSTIVCDRRALEGIPFVVRTMARLVRIEPKIDIQEETVLVRIVTLTKWGGLIQKSYTIRRSFPHTIVDEQSRTLIPYRVSWVF